MKPRARGDQSALVSGGSFTGAPMEVVSVTPDTSNGQEDEEAGELEDLDEDEEEEEEDVEAQLRAAEAAAVPHPTSVVADYRDQNIEEEEEEDSSPDIQEAPTAAPTDAFPVQLSALQSSETADDESNKPPALLAMQAPVESALEVHEEVEEEAEAAETEDEPEAVEAEEVPELPAAEVVEPVDEESDEAQDQEVPAPAVPAESSVSPVDDASGTEAQEDESAEQPPAVRISKGMNLPARPRISKMRIKSQLMKRSSRWSRQQRLSRLRLWMMRRKFRWKI